MLKLHILIFVIFCINLSLQDDYRLEVVTGNVWWASTGAKVYIKLYGDGVESSEVQLGSRDYGEYGTYFETGSTNSFTRRFSRNLGIISRVFIRHDGSGYGSDWYLSRVVVRDLELGGVFQCTCNAWLQTNERERFLPCVVITYPVTTSTNPTTTTTTRRPTTRTTTRSTTTTTTTTSTTTVTTSRPTAAAAITARNKNTYFKPTTTTQQQQLITVFTATEATTTTTTSILSAPIYSCVAVFAVIVVFVIIIVIVFRNKRRFANQKPEVDESRDVNKVRNLYENVSFNGNTTTTTTNTSTTNKAGNTAVASAETENSRYMTLTELQQVTAADKFSCDVMYANINSLQQKQRPASHLYQSLAVGLKVNNNKASSKTVVN